MAGGVEAAGEREPFTAIEGAVTGRGAPSVGGVTALRQYVHVGQMPGARVLLTIKVADVDAVCATLQARGVTLLNGPIDRPWGRRTAAFADPSGHVWEVAQELG